jgi:hypothetical protein
MREFMPDGEWSFPLRGGDELTVFGPRNRALFQGLLEDEAGRYESVWMQKGVPPTHWDSWFRKHYKAHLRTWWPNPGYNVQISSSLRP